MGLSDSKQCGLTEREIGGEVGWEETGRANSIGDLYLESVCVVDITIYNTSGYGLNSRKS